MKYSKKLNPRPGVRLQQFYRRCEIKLIPFSFSGFTVYVFLGETMSLRIFIQAIEDRELWQANRYLVISCDAEAFSTYWATSFLQCNMSDNFSNQTLLEIFLFFLAPREIQKEMESESGNWDTNSILTESRKFHSYSNLIENSWLPDVPPSTKRSPSRDDFRTITTPGILMVVRNIANEHLNTFTRRLRWFSSNQTEEVLNIF
jgi:hypothetical protein